MPNSLPYAPVASRARFPRRVLVALAFSGAVPFASGADFGVGVAVGPDRGRVDCIAAFPCDRSSTAWKLNATWYAGDALELQAAWFGAGRFRGGDRTDAGTDFGGDFKVQGLGLSAGYRWSFAPRWSLAGRLGVASVRTTFDYAAPFAGSVSKTIVAPLAGVGVAYALSPALRIGIDLDQTRFEAHSRRGSLRMAGVAAQYSF